MKIQGVPAFAWQAGYGAFSVSEAQAATVVRYIQNQEEHHRKLSFQTVAQGIALGGFRRTHDVQRLPRSAT
jgi:Transposase IS200 like